MTCLSLSSLLDIDQNEDSYSLVTESTSTLIPTVVTRTWRYVATVDDYDDNWYITTRRSWTRWSSRFTLYTTSTTPSGPQTTNFALNFKNDTLANPLNVNKN